MILLFSFLFLLLFTPVTEAYIGPGAGFAFISSFMVIIVSFILVFFSLLTYPIRFIYKLIKRRKIFRNAKAKRVVVMGLDGMDPLLTRRFMAEGLLPNFKKLAQQGTFQELATSTPSISPVAWSSFQTGCNPGKHNIFDFLSRDPGTYLPDLSSARIGNPKRSLKIGKYAFPVGKPEMRLLRKSKPFWITLGEFGINSAIIRVPITFPPEKYKGLSLSAMCVPDLLGTQGTFTFYTTDKAKTVSEGGQIFYLDRQQDPLRTHIKGPANPVKRDEEYASLPLEIQPVSETQARIRIGSKKITLTKGTYSDWIELTFTLGPFIKVNGIAKFLLSSLSPQLELYMTPIHIDPEKPALPISHSMLYAIYLAKKFGKYATLGLAEDTWALSEEVIDDEAFITQVYDFHEEREQQFFDGLQTVKNGVVACVFDTTDRMQHMFFRYLDERHPARRGKDIGKKQDIIKDLYVKMDGLLGRLMASLKPKDVLMILSDHGFKSFRRGVNINTWLLQQGLLAYKQGETPGKWYAGVDWRQTKAYGFGLAGIYLNVKGRESQGIVTQEETEAVKQKIIDGLTGLRDPETGEVAIKQVYNSAKTYTGPYSANAPDLIVGYAEGYRASWDSTTGTLSDSVFEDNTSAWSGDHSMNPCDVPGVFFSNKRVAEQDVHIMDLAPTILSLFGIKKPAYMDGRVLDVAI